MNTSYSCLAAARRAAMMIHGRILLAVAAMLICSPTICAAVGDRVAEFDPVVDGFVYTTAIQPDGKILIAGEFGNVGGSARLRLARLNADGSLDTDFVPTPIYGEGVRSIALQPDGKILIGGDFLTFNGTTGRSNLARLNADGSLDTNFISNPDGAVSAMALQDDGQLVVAGDFTTLGSGSATQLARVDSSGTIDPTFFASQIDAAVNAVLIQPDGKILIGGNFTTISTLTRNHLARLDSSGFPDAGFTPDTDGSVSALALQPDGRIFVGGTFTHIAGVSRDNLARLETDGSADTTFVTGTNYEVSCLTLQADGDLLVGGWFSLIGGQARSYAAKLDNTGTVDPDFIPSPDQPILALNLLESGQVLAAGVFSSIGGGNQANCALLENEAATSNFLVHGYDRAEWLRGGSAPAFTRVNFDASTDGGSTWSPLGDGTANGSNWELDSLGLAGSGLVRARGHVGDGSYYNGSSIHEATATYPVFTVTFDLADKGTRTGGGELVQRIDPGQAATAPTLETIGDWMFIGWDTDISTVNNNLTVNASYARPGMSDEDFGANTNHTVRAVAVQQDGKILVGGDFTSLNGASQAYLARLHADGSPDTSFTPAFNYPVYSIAVQPDGRIVVGGIFSTINSVNRRYCARLFADGTLDTTFNPQAGGYVYTVALERDGSILVGGSFSSVAGTTRSNLARLMADGTLDAGFYPQPGGAIYCIAIEGDGDILAGGSFGSVWVQISPTSSGTYPRSNIARFTRDGVLDNSFHPDPNAQVSAIVVQPDGKIIVGGSFSAIDGSSMANLSRLNSNGTIDASFWLNPSGSVSALALQEDGKVYVGGTFTSIKGSGLYRHLARVTSDGDIDTSFMPTYATSPFSTGANVLTIAQQADGKVLTGGISYNYYGTVLPYFDRLWNEPASQSAALTSADHFEWTWSATSPQAARVDLEISRDGGSTWHHFAQAAHSASGWEINTLGLLGAGQLRANANLSYGSYCGGSGMLQATFSYDFGGTAHMVTFDPGSHGQRSGGGLLNQLVTDGEAASAPTVNANDGWVFDGWDIAYDNVTSDLTVTAQYGVAPGYLDLDFDPNCLGTVYATAQQPDGKILVGGNFGSIGGLNRSNLARLHADGSVDTDFDAMVSGWVYAIAVQPDGKILVGGPFTTIAGQTRNRIARLNPDGSLDADFNPNANNIVRSIIVQPDGDILVAGDFTAIAGQSRNRIARLHADGSLDTSFNPNANEIVFGIALQPDGKVLVGGRFTAVGGQPRYCIARLNTNGTVDNSFNSSVNNWVYSVMVQPDGKIVMAGQFTGGITRLNPNGSWDYGFAPSANNTVYSTALQADGKILMAGGFSSVAGQSRNCIARLNSDGSLDTGFAPAANNTVQNIALQADGTVLVGGAFTTIQGATRNRIARIINDPATQNLAVSDTGRVEWLRGGTSAEASRVTFELSPDGGEPWTALGDGTRISGGWELSGLDLETTGWIRARAYVNDGANYSSSSIIEETTAFAFHAVTFDLTAIGTRSGGGELVQLVADGGAATAPEITPTLGWSFNGWDQALTNITGPLTIQALYVVSPGSFHEWMASHSLSGDPATTFNQIDPATGLPCGLCYALGTNLQAGEPVLRVIMVNGNPVVEVTSQDPTTSAFADLVITGSTTLGDGSWTLPIVPAADTTGKPSHRAWFQQDGTPAPTAVFRLEGSLR